MLVILSIAIGAIFLILGASLFIALVFGVLSLALAVSLLVTNPDLSREEASPAGD